MVRRGVIFQCWLLASTVFAQSHATRPSAPPVAEVVEAQFAKIPDYQQGDLVSRSQIVAAIASLESVGYELTPTQSKAILERSLADDSFLVTSLSTPTGRSFMRKIAAEPGAYARLDRLSTVPRGKALIHDLIRYKGGDELIRYMATTKGGHELGKQMAAAPRGVDLNKPTGRIYTANELIQTLQAMLPKQ